VIDSGVYDKEHDNVALSKNDFAENILNEVDEFKDLDVSEFTKIFEIITTIIAGFNRDR
jgi:hypothetical protein